MKRAKMSKSGSRKLFRKGCKTEVKNIARPQRGGIRL